MGDVQFYDDGSGNTVLFDSGKVAMHADCCCGYTPSEDECADCAAGTTPATVQVVLDVDDYICTGCLTDSGSQSVEWTNPAFDGVHCCVQGTPFGGGDEECTWHTLIENALDWEYWSSSTTCPSGSPDQSGTADVYLIVTRSGGAWNVELEFDIGPLSGSPFIGASAAKGCDEASGIITNTRGCGFAWYTPLGGSSNAVVRPRDCT